MDIGWVVAVFSAAGLIAGACGEASFDEETSKRLDGQQSQADDIGTRDSLDLTADQDACLLSSGGQDLAELIVSGLSDPTTVGDESRLEVVAALIECVPALGEVTAFVDNFTETINLVLGPGANVDHEEGSCIVQYIVDNAADPAEAIAIGTSPNSVATTEDAFVTCLDPQSLAFLEGEPGSGPQSYGDHADFDVLYDLCDAGTETACDLLYYEANAGSQYSELAIDCAGRGDGLTYCTPGVLAAADGSIDGDSPGLFALESQCSAGDMLSCDLLFVSSPIGSDMERVGNTCGGLIAGGAVPNCRTRFGG